MIFKLNRKESFKSKLDEESLNMIQNSLNIAQINCRNPLEDDFISKVKYVSEAIEMNQIRKVPRVSKEKWTSHISWSLMGFRIAGLMTTIAYSKYRLNLKFKNSTIVNDGVQVSILANSILIFDDLYRSIFIESNGARSFYSNALMLELTYPNSTIDQSLIFDSKKAYILQKTLQPLEWMLILHLWRRSNYILLPIFVYQAMYLLDREIKKYNGFEK
jgi:hypothetical protein